MTPAASPAPVPGLPGPLRVAGRDPSRAITFPVPLLLAPMEGITESCFRELVIALGAVGGACSEFVRVSAAPASARVIRRQLGTQPADCPVGVQFMFAEERHVAASVLAAERAGAVWIDLNFGCPAPVVFDKCAGSALLAHPQRLERIIATAVAATGLPVSVKMRAGIDGCNHLDDLVGAAAAAGAAMITLHARLRTQSYAHPASWEWIARAAATLAGRVPLIGNGGIERAEDAAAMLRQTGCQGAMVGRAALADPWIFSRARGAGDPGPAAAAAFAMDYARALAAAYGAATATARLKQLIKYYRAGGLFAGREEERRRLLREPALEDLVAWFAAAGGSVGALAPSGDAIAQGEQHAGQRDQRQAGDRGVVG